MKNLKVLIKIKSIADQWLANELFNTQAYQDAKSIGFVLSMPHEVDTYHLIESSIMNDKKVYVPETDYKNKRMSFKRLLSLNDIEKMKKESIMLFQILNILMTWIY